MEGKQVKDDDHSRLCIEREEHNKTRVELDKWRERYSEMKGKIGEWKALNDISPLAEVVPDLIQTLVEITTKTDEVLHERALDYRKWKDPTDLALFIERIGKIANKARHNAMQVYINKANPKERP